ncbi:hypothetical protein [Aureimonas pseudogalii]|uniref:Uncharacterized protein n=1 Tax=Aureimonas pseudogalii TaxID=1744844 RepID=A0A7W6ECQ6_9HYPH|nr:hypothetical protein [Aureimonas pseudogalii]MBB3997616.1 hypothetical protein [Aureimonas pseudogalii]
MSNLAAALLALVFFAPLAFVYGRQVAGGLHRAARAAGLADARGRLALVWPKLVLPLVLGPAMLYRLAGASPLAGETASSGTLRTALSLLWFAGSIAAILFFLTIPFVLGRLFGVAAALAGAFAAVRDEPLRFGTRERRRDRPAGAGEGGDGGIAGGATGVRRHDEPAAPDGDASDGGDGGGGDGGGGGD